MPIGKGDLVSKRREPVSQLDISIALVDAMNRGAQGAAVDTIEALAEALGVSELHGTNVRDFYNTAAHHRTEDAIAEIADDDQELAALVKQQFVKARQQSDSERDLTSSHARARAK